MKSAVVLVPLGADAGRYAGELGEIAAATGCTVAFLQLGAPSLTDELDRLRDDAVERIQLVGLGLGAPTARSWLRRVAGDWHRAYPRVEVVVGGAAVTGGEAPLTSPGWEQVPGHRHQVLVCRGPRCAARGSAATAQALSTALRDHGLGDNDVLLTQTGCLFPCNHAPVVVVHPDDVWYGRVGPAPAGRVVAEHLGAGVVVADLQLDRVRSDRAEPAAEDRSAKRGGVPVPRQTPLDSPRSPSPEAVGRDAPG